MSLQISISKTWATEKTSFHLAGIWDNEIVMHVHLISKWQPGILSILIKQKKKENSSRYLMKFISEILEILSNTRFAYFPKLVTAFFFKVNSWVQIFVHWFQEVFRYCRSTQVAHPGKYLFGEVKPSPLGLRFCRAV